MKKLPIGRDNLKDILEGDFYYVDKTKLIEEILENGTYVMLFPRPRRFGKSLMISTINEFFNAEKKKENKNLFKGLYIAKSKFSKEQGEYPVIKINLKSLQASSWEHMYEQMQEEIRQLFESKRYVMDVLNDQEKELFEKFTGGKATQAQYEQSFKILSQYMRRYYNKNVILLIDEYDVPIQKGFMKGFYDEIVEFIKNLFHNALKTNDAVKFAVMTGVLRVSKESIFSDLNNVKVYSIIEDGYDEYFGFTEKETYELLKYYNLELTPTVRQMYDGYVFGSQEIYNPWSILNYAERGRLYPYWVNTSGDELLKDLFDKTQGESAEMLEDLILGKSIVCKYNEKITFLDLDSIEREYTQEIVANFLLMSGYLTKTKDANLDFNGDIKLRIPNSEVKAVYADIIRKWTVKKTQIQSARFRDFQEALLNNKKEKLEQILNDALNSMSFYDSQENFYHGYMLGMFAEFLNIQYIVKSNREGGSGRFDIMIESQDREIGIIVEFKVAQEEESIEEKAQKGKEQIKEKEYYKELELDKVENILMYSVAFKGKKCRVV